MQTTIGKKLTEKHAPCIYNNDIWDQFEDDELRVASALLANIIEKNHTGHHMSTIMAGIRQDIKSCFNDKRN